MTGGPQFCSHNPKTVNILGDLLCLEPEVIP